MLKELISYAAGRTVKIKVNDALSANFGYLLFCTVKILFDQLGMAWPTVNVLGPLRAMLRSEVYVPGFMLCAVAH